MTSGSCLVLIAFALGALAVHLGAEAVYALPDFLQTRREVREDRKAYEARVREKQEFREMYEAAWRKYNP